MPLALFGQKYNINFVKTSTGAAAMHGLDTSFITIPEEYREELSTTDLSIAGVVGDGATDDAAALQAYITAQGANAEVNIPYGTYKVNSTLTILTSQKIDFNNSYINSDIDDGSPIISTGVGNYWFGIENVDIDGNGNYVIGLSVGEYPSSYSYVGYLRNIRIQYCYEGFNVIGWNISMDYLRTWHNSVGYVGVQNNACGIRSMWLERDTTAFRIAGTQISISNLMLQGDLVTRPSRIDDASNLSITGLYIEYNVASDSSTIIIGEYGPCDNISIQDVRAASDYAVGAYPVLFDDVDNASFGGNISVAAYDIPFMTTVNTTNLVFKNYLISNLTGAGAANKLIDRNQILGQFYNYFPNSSFETFLRGYDDISLSTATTSQETSIVRSGKSALKVSFGDRQSELY